MAKKITLRKSAAIQKELFGRAHNLDIETNVEINQFNHPNEAIETGLREVLDALTHKQNLLSVLYSLRAKTGVVNAKAGVSAMLAEQERIKHTMAIYRNFISEKPRAELFEIQQRAEKLKEQTEERFGRDSFSVSVFDKNDVKGFKQTINELKKKFQTLNDSILELNVKKTVELNAEEEEILVKEDLI